MGERPISVEIVSAQAAGLVRRRIQVPAGSSVKQVVDASGIGSELPADAVRPDRLGIFGAKVGPEQVVRDGDRVEIYRPLLLDPMEARRRRAR